MCILKSRKVRLSCAHQTTTIPTRCSNFSMLTISLRELTLCYICISNNNWFNRDKRSLIRQLWLSITATNSSSLAVISIHTQAIPLWWECFLQVLWATQLPMLHMHRVMPDPPRNSIRISSRCIPQMLRITLIIPIIRAWCLDNSLHELNIHSDI